MDNEIREAFNRITARIKRDKEIDGVELDKQLIEDEELILSVISDYLACSGRLPKEKTEDDLKEITWAEICAYNLARHECILAMMKRVSVERIEEILNTYTPHHLVAQYLYQSIIGEEGK